MSSRDAASAFVDAMLTARLTGDFTPVAGCLGEVPGVFTGEPPYCWTECAGARRTISLDHAFTAEGGDVSGAQYLFTTLPVSYAIGNDYVDVWESWRLDAAPEGYVASGFSIEEPPFNREGALAVIVEYFDAIQRQDWNAVAAMLDDGAINSEERFDLQELAPTTYAYHDVASALEQWCAGGCDTIAPTLDDLVFDGRFGIERYGREIFAAWFEGQYSISGLPFKQPTG